MQQHRFVGHAGLRGHAQHLFNGIEDAVIHGLGERQVQTVLLLAEMHGQHFVPFHQGKRNKLGRRRHATRIRAKNRNRPLGGDGSGDLLFADSFHAYKNLAQPRIRLLLLPLKGGLERMPVNVSSGHQLEPQRDAVLPLILSAFRLLQ